MKLASEAKDTAGAVGPFELEQGNERFELSSKLHGMLYKHQVRFCQTSSSISALCCDQSFDASALVN